MEIEAVAGSKRFTVKVLSIIGRTCMSEERLDYYITHEDFLKWIFQQQDEALDFYKAAPHGSIDENISITKVKTLSAVVDMFQRIAWHKAEIKAFQEGADCVLNSIFPERKENGTST